MRGYVPRVPSKDMYQPSTFLLFGSNIEMIQNHIAKKKNCTKNNFFLTHPFKTDDTLEQFIMRYVVCVNRV